MSAMQNEIAIQAAYEAGLEMGMTEEEAQEYALTGKEPASFTAREDHLHFDSDAGEEVTEEEAV